MKKIEKSRVFKKSILSFHSGKQRMQSTLQALHFDTERLKNSVPSDAILKQFCDESEFTSRFKLSSSYTFRLLVLGGSGSDAGYATQRARSSESGDLPV